MGIAGICLIRLKYLRPPAVPIELGFSSENAAHRIAVEWEERGEYHEGVYIPRRDTSSRFTALIGGRLFPGVHHHAHFQVREEDETFSVQMASDDGQTRVTVAAQLAAHMPARSVFASLQEASAFFERGFLGYSVTKQAGKLDVLELRCRNWMIEPLQVTEAHSSFFDDPKRFPAGTAELDGALVMRAIRHQWHVHRPFYSSESVNPAQSRQAIPA